uniref:Uncharacterized protein n=1 Tax=Knipowitschia caucasica TaxID=637954 RepID=A0AAV2KL62_KNICA
MRPLTKKPQCEGRSWGWRLVASSPRFWKAGGDYRDRLMSTQRHQGWTYACHRERESGADCALSPATTPGWLPVPSWLQNKTARSVVPDLF